VTAGIVVTGALALLAAVGVVGFRETIYSALSLAANMVLLAVLFLLLNAQFLAAVQVIIYAGAVMVLFVFIIALLNPGAEEEHPARDPRFGLGLVVLAYITVQVYALATNGTTYDKNSSQHPLRGATIARQADPRDTSFGFTPDVVNSGGNVQTVGGQLFTTFILPFEITSAILLVAAIGAVYLTRKPPPQRT
jgi:NADH-quinone oxidoreductase subunit J